MAYFELRVEISLPNMIDFSTKKNLVLLRGLPGAGKSSLAVLLSENGKYPIFSLDDYFTNAKGEYQFEFDKNHLAYKQCEGLTEAAMAKHVAKIFVHNTFVYDWEIEPFLKLQKKYGYTLFVLTVENFHNNKNTHGVSDEQLEKMAMKYAIKLL